MHLTFTWLKNCLQQLDLTAAACRKRDVFRIFHSIVFQQQNGANFHPRRGKMDARLHSVKLQKRQRTYPWQINSPPRHRDNERAGVSRSASCGLVRSDIVEIVVCRLLSAPRGDRSVNGTGNTNDTKISSSRILPHKLAPTSAASLRRAGGRTRAARSTNSLGLSRERISRINPSRRIKGREGGRRRTRDSRVTCEAGGTYAGHLRAR